MNFKSVIFSAILCTSVSSIAEDIEIYSSNFPYEPYGTGEIALPNPNYPNILFVLDASASMDHLDKGYTTTRLTRLRQAMDTVLSNAKNVNVGIMRLSNLNSGGRIIYPMSSIDYAREEVKNAVNTMELDYWTPTMGAMLEAAFYFGGSNVHYGKSRAAEYSNKHYNIEKTRVSHPESYTGGELVRADNCTDDNLNHISCASERIDGEPVYISPIVHECQQNYMVMINDGGATGKVDTTLAEDLTGGSCVESKSNTCGVELARFMSTQDQAPDVPGINTVTTYTVGFNATIPPLEDIAKAGGGKYFESSSADELAKILTHSVLQAAAEGNKTFVAPAITLDQFTRFSHRDDMYLALFQPGSNQRWQGNLKKYRYDGAVKDQNDALALDTSTASFVTTAHSYWSEDADGGNIAIGGAAHELDADDRNVYTYLAGNNNDLTDTTNLLTEANDLITATMLGVPESEVDNLLQWTRGIDVDDEFPDSNTRLQMGDPLHSRPTILTYGGTETNPDSVVFFGTNEGFLHAINSSDGKEVFAFIPEELLGNLNTYYENLPTRNRLYGMDGDITLWVNDVNHNGVISGTEHAYLYTGMRRGGRNYYGLNVSDKTKPTHLWTIKGGETPGFEKLGQSWSKPTLARISLGGVATDVLIFAGGYDPMQDISTIRSADTVGNDLYIVNATTGALIWNTATASDPSVYDDGMKYSIPSDTQIIDVNGDGLVDQIYVGDMGGQVWRFDVNSHANVASELVSGGIIATLSGTLAADNRRFFYRPDVALVQQGVNKVLSVSIGSGNRSHPLDTSVGNRFYMIRQESALEAPKGYGIVDKLKSTTGNTVYRPITEADLYDATENLIDSTEVNIADSAAESLAKKEGWIIKLGSPGEKVLASSLTVSDQVIFSTYLPDSTIVNCVASAGSGKTYSVSVLDATPTDGNTPEERSEFLITPGIPSEPIPIIDSHGELSVVIGVEEAPTPEFKDMLRVYWSEQPDY